MIIVTPVTALNVPSRYDAPSFSPEGTSVVSAPLAKDTAVAGGTTRRLAEFVARTRFDDIPDDVRRRTKHLILDAIGCGMLGARLPWSQVAVNGLAAVDDGTSATVWGHGRRMTGPSAALLNGTFVQSFELDDYYEHGPLHSGSVVVPSLLATIETLGGADGTDILRAAAVGFEVGPRLGVALDGYELLNRGWHCGAIYGVLASAATAAAVRKLDADAVEHALGIAGTQASGLMAAQYESMVKRMHHGFAARNGMVSAALAATGYSGIAEVLERPYGGMRHTFNPDTADLSRAVEDLGSRWDLMGINVKPYAAMAGTHPAIDGALQLRDTLGITPASVRSLVIELPLVPFKHGGWVLSRPATVIGAQMNAAYAAAAVLCDGQALAQQFSPDRIAADDIWDLMECIEVRHSQEMDALAAATGHKRVTRMTLTTTQGHTEQIVVQVALGQGHRLMTDQQIVTKYRALTDLVMPTERSRALEDAVLNIEDSAAEVIGLLAGSVEPLFTEDHGNRSATEDGEQI